MNILNVSEGTCDEITPVCDINCKDCTYRPTIDVDDVCSACKNGYNLTDNKCILICDKACSGCTISATNCTECVDDLRKLPSCTTCIDGYEMKDETCQVTCDKAC